MRQANNRANEQEEHGELEIHFFLDGRNFQSLLRLIVQLVDDVALRLCRREQSDPEPVLGVWIR